MNVAGFNAEAVPVASVDAIPNAHITYDRLCPGS